MFYLVDTNREYILNFLPKNIVTIEIGVQDGVFSEKILQIVRPSTHHMVDPYILHTNAEYYPDPANVSMISQDIIYNKVLNRFSLELNNKTAFLHRKLSTEAVCAFPDNYFDFIYIDAMHFYDAVLSDLKSYAPKLKTGGILAGHDYSINNNAKSMNFGVVEAVRDFLMDSDLRLFFITNEHFSSYFLAEPNSPLMQSVFCGLNNTTKTIFSLPNFFIDKVFIEDHHGQRRTQLSGFNDPDGSHINEYFEGVQGKTSVEEVPPHNYFIQLVKSVVFRFLLLLLLFVGRRKDIIDYVFAPRFFCKKLFSAKATWIPNQSPFSEKFAGTAELFVACKDKEKIRLHFGCGPRILKDWINIDLQYTSYDSILHYFDGYMDYFNEKVYPPEIQGGKEDLFLFDATKEQLPLADGSVDVVFHEDFFEHLDQKEQFLFLAETYRVLKPGAIHRINTPDLDFAMREYDKKKGLSGVPVNIWDKAAHKNIVNKKILNEMALLAGYSRIIFTEHNKSAASGLPYEYRPGQGRSFEENLYADLIK